MAGKPAEQGVTLPKLDLRTIEVPIIGDSPLICHAWSQKALTMLADKHQMRAARGREAKDPWRDFTGALYWMSEHGDPPTEEDVRQGRFGFPATGIKSAAVDACTSVATLTKVAARQAFHLTDELVEILGPAPSMREDIARVAMGAPDVRYRPEFNPWGMILRVTLNASVMSEEQVVSLFDLAGFAVGIGDWRPQRGGPYGRFHVAKAREKLPCR